MWLPVFWQILKYWSVYSSFRCMSLTGLFDFFINRIQKYILNNILVENTHNISINKILYHTYFKMNHCYYVFSVFCAVFILIVLIKLCVR